MNGIFFLSQPAFTKIAEDKNWNEMVEWPGSEIFTENPSLAKF